MTLGGGRQLSRGPAPLQLKLWRDKMVDNIINEALDVLRTLLVDAPAAPW
jgi:hypothetical protein